MEKRNRVAIIILNQNKKKDILECLDSVIALEYSPYDIIVVDNGSTDGSAEEIKKKYARVYLVEKHYNSGAAGGRNAGVRFAANLGEYEFFLFLDNDVILDPNALREMVQSFTASVEIGMVTPKCLKMNDKTLLEYAGGMEVNLYIGKIDNIGGMRKDKGQYEKPEYISASGGLFLIRCDAYRQIGEFDEKFNPYGWEDVDFALRARKLGYKIRYSPTAIIYHKGGRHGRTENIAEYEYAKVRNYFYLLSKHLSIWQWVTFTFALPYRVFAMIWTEWRGGHREILLYKVQGLFKLFRL